MAMPLSAKQNARPAVAELLADAIERAVNVNYRARDPRAVAAEARLQRVGAEE